MKILFCTNTFETVANGPAKFANILLNLNNLHPQHEIRILTEDVVTPGDKVYKITVNIPQLLKFAGMFLRMFQYHHAAMRIRKTEYCFDAFVYNNAIVGLWSAVFFKNTCGFINDDNNSSSSMWRNIFTYKWAKSLIFKKAESIACILFKKIIVNSKYMLSHIAYAYPCSKRKLFLLYKGIDVPDTITFKAQLNSPLQIVFAKNDYLRGGLFVLIDALKLLNAEFKLTIIGVPASANSKIEAALQHSKIGYEIFSTIPPEKVKEIMLHADIVCVPSYKEAFGVVNLEGLACGCSVISTAVGGIPEALANGSCGWLVPPGNAADLSAAITECINSPALRKKKFDNAGSHLRNFSSASVIYNLIKILEAN